MTVHRTSDNYPFSSEMEFFADSGENNWHDVWVKKIIL